ncbi:MAG: M48 family metallopeptidase [Bacteroidota bacterium]
MNADQLLYLILGILTFSFALERCLSWLNMRHHQRQLPPSLQGRYDSEKYQQSYDYHRANYQFGWIQSVISTLSTLAILYFGGFGWLDQQLRGLSEHAVYLPLLFFGVLFVVSDVLSLPFQLYGTFVIEEKFGFNRTTPRLFFVDKLKSWVMGILIGGLVMGTLLLLVDALGENFWIWFWVFISAFMLVMNVFYTSIFLPLFNKLSPLESGSLRTAIENYSEQVSFPLDNILVMDGSKRSNKANAFFSGLGKQKKVVLFDTLIDNHSEDELVAVLAHEVGHYKKRHIIQSLVLGILQTGLILFILSRFIQSPVLSAAMGSPEVGVHLNLLAFGLLFSPISTIIGVFLNIFSRKNEFEADRFAAETYSPTPLKEALIRLHADNLSNLTPHPWHVFMNYSHPPLLKRLEALDS